MSTTKLELPQFFDMLSEIDQKKYFELCASLSSGDIKFQRNRRCQTLQLALMEIKRYCVLGDEEDWKRCLICGVCWMGFDIAINTRRLSKIIDKCKSSINGALHQLGYGQSLTKSEVSERITSFIPFLKDKFNELKFWSIRTRFFNSPYPQVSINPQQFNGFSPFISPQPQFFQPQPVATFMAEKESIFGIPDIKISSDQSECKIEMVDKNTEFTEDACCCPLKIWFEQQGNDYDTIENLIL